MRELIRRRGFVPAAVAIVAVQPGAGVAFCAARLRERRRAGAGVVRVEPQTA